MTSSSSSASPMPKPHEIQFQYDEKLFSSCALSLLSRGGNNDDKNTAHSTNRHHDPSRVVVNTNYDDTVIVSPLDEDETEVIATPNSDDDQSSDILLQSSREHNQGNNNDCRVLFEQHAAHYQRPTLTKDEIQYWEKAATTNKNWDEEEGGGTALITPRIQAFLQSVVFVHDHNTKCNESESEVYHTVTLNRFSDKLLHELPLMSTTTTATTTTVDDIENFSPQEVVSLHEEEDIYNIGMELGRLWSGDDVEQQQQQQTTTTTTTTSIPATTSFSNIFDSWWWLGDDHDHYFSFFFGRGGKQQQQDDDESAAELLARSRNKKKHHHHHHHHDNSIKSNTNKLLLSNENELDGLKDEDGATHHDKTWDKYLNWSTKDNPDGVRIVHDPIDQGYCGSCWAVSATGTIEASIARNMAYIAYEDAYHTHKSHSHDTRRQYAISIAQQIEHQAINTANLSIQELIDCDTRYDQGCSGGNPLLAFYFLHKFGVTSAHNYPYTGHDKDTCRYRKMDEPVATVKSWGIMTADHENNIEKVLRYIGPVAVGLIGGDPAFLSYQGGVFHSSKGGKCDTGQPDHAMLIVGYGQEYYKGRLVKYWIARNSWGTGWGENGYVRVARVGGSKGHQSVCGIAHSPSVALGGMFTKDVTLEKFKSSKGLKTRVGDYRINGKYLHDGSRLDKSFLLRCSYQIQSTIHDIRDRLGFAQKGIMMSTVSGDEKSDVSGEMPLMMMMLGLLVSLLFGFMIRKRHGRRRSTVERRRSSLDEESVVLGETTHLLENKSTTNYN